MFVDRSIKLQIQVSLNEKEGRYYLAMDGPVFSAGNRNGLCNSEIEAIFTRKSKGR